MAIYSSIGIQASVGKNGKNRPVDVITVQTRLNELMRGPRKNLTEDGKIGSKTIGMIRDFQKCVLNYRRPDSRVDPNGKSHQALNDPASESKWARMSFVTEPDAPVQSATSADRDYRNLESMRGKDLAGTLGHFEAWIGRNPLEIKRLVIRAGGWSTVFPKRQKFPLWASRVRNFFNTRPLQLTQLDLQEGGRSKRRLSLNPGSLKNLGFLETFSLSGDVYEDENDRPWFEMSTTATVYHFSGKVNSWKIVRNFFRTQRTTPVFKLISPDGTGGSFELCVHNWQHWGSTKRSEIGPVGKVVLINGMVVINEHYQGSYNFSETGVLGKPAHDHRDVAPHIHEDGFYIPVRSTSDIKSRRFPPEDGKGRSISDSDDYYKT